MDAVEAKQADKIQLYSLALVVLGLLCTAIGCKYHFSELTTVSAGVVGGGLGLITGRQTGATLNNKAGGTIAVGTEPNPFPQGGAQ